MIKYTVLITPILMGLGLVLALLTAPITLLLRATRAIIFMPVVIGLASLSLLWFWLFGQQVGLLNRLLVDLGILDKPPVWSKRANSGIWAVNISVVWKVLSFGMILMVGGMQSIPRDLFEAACIDGASFWMTACRIVLPLATQSILLATLLSVIGSMLAFEQFYLMTGGGPSGQTFTSLGWIYQNSFVRFELGYEVALSVSLMVVIASVTALQLWLTRKKGEH